MGTHNIEDTLKKLGIKIPEVLAPVANYVGFVKSCTQVFISGQLPIEDGQVNTQEKLAIIFPSKTLKRLPGFVLSI